MDLLEHAEGDRQDRIAQFSLWFSRQEFGIKKRVLESALRKSLSRQRMSRPSDLHLKEMLVNALMFGGDTEDGWQCTHGELAEILWSKKEFCKTIVTRMCRDVRLIDRSEGTYMTGAQAGNIYHINVYVVADLLIDEWNCTPAVKPPPPVVKPPPHGVKPPTPAVKPPLNKNSYSVAVSLTESNLRSGSPDHKFGNRLEVLATSIEDRVGEVFESMRYCGDQGQSVWLCVAAERVGVLSEHAIADAMAAVMAVRPADPPAYFRRVVAEKSGYSLGELKRELSRVKVLPRLPGGRPPRSPITAARATVKPVPQAQSIEDRRRDVLETLKALG